MELRVVELVEIVERPDGVARLEQTLANVRSDETRAAGDQEVHAPMMRTDP